MLTLAVLFALPHAAHLLSQTVAELVQVRGGAAPRDMAVWVLAFALFLSAVFGGWRATVLVVAVGVLLLAVLVIGAAGFAGALLPGPGFLAHVIATHEGILHDCLPRDCAGLGRDRQGNRAGRDLHRRCHPFGRSGPDRAQSVTGRAVAWHDGKGGPKPGLRNGLGRGRDRSCGAAYPCRPDARRIGGPVVAGGAA